MSGRDPLVNKRPDELSGPVVDFFAGSKKPPAAAVSRSAQGVPPPAPVTAVPAPAAILPAPRVGGLSPHASSSRSGGVVGGFDADPTGIPNIRRITDTAQPGAAPLYTNIAGADAARGIFDKPFVSPESLSRTLATSSVFNGVDPLAEARQAAAGRGDFDAVDRSYRSDEQQVAHDLSQAHGAFARGVTNSLSTGVPAKIFPEIGQSLGYLNASNAKAAPGLDLGDYAALSNAETNAGNLAVNQAKLTQTAAADAAKAERAGLNSIAKMSVNPETGLFDPALYDRNLIQYGPVFGLGGGTSAAPTALDVASDAAEKLRKTGKYTEAQIQQVLKQRAGQ